MKEQISYDIFNKVDIRIGTVLSVKKNAKAKKPSLIIEVDFGNEIGVKQSSAQITHFYNEENLRGKQVIGVCNFPEKYCRYSFTSFNVRLNRQRRKSCFSSSITKSRERSKNSINHYGIS